MVLLDRVSARHCRWTSWFELDSRRDFAMKHPGNSYLFSSPELSKSPEGRKVMITNRRANVDRTDFIDRTVSLHYSDYDAAIDRWITEGGALRRRESYA